MATLPAVDRFAIRWAQLRTWDEAKRKAGELIGRYFTEPYADSCAVYQVVKVSKASVRIKVVTGIGDDWRIPYWGDEATVRRSYVEQKIAQRDRMEALFAERTKQREAGR